MNTNTLKSIKGFETGLLFVICHNLSLWFFPQGIKNSQIACLQSAVKSPHWRQKDIYEDKMNSNRFSILLSLCYLQTNFE